MPFSSVKIQLATKTIKTRMMMTMMTITILSVVEELHINKNDVGSDRSDDEQGN